MSDNRLILDSMHQAMQNNSIFGNLLATDDREYLLQKGTIRPVRTGEILCKQFQYDTSVYIILSGRVEVSEEVQGDHVSLGSLGSGELFGEIGALFMMPRIATVTATKPSVVLEIPGLALGELVERSPLLRDAVYERYRSRTIRTALRSVRIFSALPENVIDELTDAATIVTAKQDDHFIQEGEQGDSLYIINYGIARVYKQHEDRETNLALLRGGDYFGEAALLSDSPRGASVAAVTRMELVRLGQEDFLDFVVRYPDTLENIDLIAQERKNRTEFACGESEAAQDTQRMLSEIERILVAEYRANAKQ